MNNDNDIKVQKINCLREMYTKVTIFKKVFCVLYNKDDIKMNEKKH